MTSSDPERIPAYPTTDAEPPAATSVVTGPSQVPTSPADGRGRRSWGRRALIGLVLAATFTVGIGVGQVAPSVMGSASATPNPSTASSDLGLFKEAWDAIHTQYVGRADLDDRALWDDYQDAFQDAICKTSTDDAPWYVVPGDSKWVRNLVIAKILRHHLERIDPQYPPAEEGVEGLVVS